MAVNRSNINVAYGITNALQQVPPQPIVSQRNPTGRDQAETGTIWVNSATNAYWINTSTTAGQTNWEAAASGVVETITGGNGINITGTATNPVVNLTAPVSIANGGTNATSMTNTNGVSYFDGTRLVTTTVGTTGQILTSNGVGVAPTFQDAPATGIEEITGDVGSGATGSSILFSALLSGDTCLFSANGAQVDWLATDSNQCTAIGAGATAVGSGTNSTAFGNSADATGDQSTAIGAGSTAANVGAVAVGRNSNVIADESTAVGTSASCVSPQAVAIGSGAVVSCDTGVAIGYVAATGTGIGSVSIGSAAGSSNATLSNVAIGVNALTTLDAAVGSNVAIGGSAITLAEGASRCVSVGYGSLSTLFNGAYNCALGYNAGSAYNAAESSNVSINNPGTAAESNTLRIGVGTGIGNQELNAAFIAGIQGITVTGTPVLISTSDQLGIAVSSERFKEDIQDMGSSSNDVLSLRPVTFLYKKDSAEGLANASSERQFGLIAEEVFEVMPSLVVLDSEGKPLTVKYHDLPAILLNEIKKLNERIAKLENGNV